MEMQRRKADGGKELCVHTVHVHVVCVQKCLVKTTPYESSSGPLCSTEARRGGGGSGGKEGCELERWRAVPFADWNEWYGAAVTIHACSFTSFSHSPSPSARSSPHLRILGATTRREGNEEEGKRGEKETRG